MTSQIAALIAMDEGESTRGSFIGYEYRDVTIEKSQESMYIDAYMNFGWLPDGEARPHVGIGSVTMKFKRDRKIRNKAELTRLQRQFEACALELVSMEKSKESSAISKALVVGIIGTAFLAGATFSFLGGLYALCIVLAVPGFIGWALPYHLYRSTFAKKSIKLTPLIDKKYDEIYEICERANALLGN